MVNFLLLLVPSLPLCPSKLLLPLANPHTPALLLRCCLSPLQSWPSWKADQEEMGCFMRLGQLQSGDRSPWILCMCVPWFSLYPSIWLQDLGVLLFQTEA